MTRARTFGRDRIEWALFAFALALGIGLCTNFLHVERSTINSGERERLKVQAEIAGEVLEGQIEGIRQALRVLRENWGEEGPTSRDLQLSSLKRATPGLLALMVVNSRGSILASSEGDLQRHLKDQLYVEEIARMSDVDDIYLSQPFKNARGDSTVKVSVIDRPGTDRARVFTAVVRMEYFDAVLRSIDSAGGASTSLATEDGGAVFEHRDEAASDAPSDPPVSNDTPPQPGEYPRVVQRDDDVSFGVRRIIENDKLRMSPPLVLEIRRSRHIVEKTWRDLAQVYIGSLLLLTLLGALALRGLQRRRHAFNEIVDRRAAENLEQAQRMTLTLASTQLGLWDLRMVDEELLLDERAAAIQGANALSHPMPPGIWKSWIHPEDWHQLSAAIDTHVAGGTPVFEGEYRIKHESGDWIWVQSFGKVVSRDRSGKPSRMLGTLMDIRRRKANEQEIERLAFYDSLTDLPNRRLLRRRLEMAAKASLSSGKHCALLFIDLDNFKALNDTLGHDQGDRLLQRVAERLTSVVRRDDTVSRHGGDEFVVLLAEVGESEPQALAAVAAIGRSILERLAQPYDLEGREVYSSPSIGAAIFDGRLRSTDEVLKHADLAMYAAKAAGRNTIRYFDPEMQRSLDAQAQMESDLRTAVLRREFVVHYQSIHRVDGDVIGFEALIRWTRQSGANVSPAEFIPIAERIGMIVEIGRQVLDMACKQIASWCSSGVCEKFSVSVNVSPRQIRQPEFVATVMECLIKHQAHPNRLKLELTEGILVADSTDVIEKMNALRAIGVRFSVDDFGTGYSSLSYLRNLPLSQLKIDRSFVAHLPASQHDATIVKAIIGMAGSLGLDVVAEGVETIEQLDFLIANGCEAFQGYYFSRPQPLERIQEFSKSRQSTD